MNPFMEKIYYIDRQSGTRCTEEVYGESAVRLLYGKGFRSKSIGRLILHFFAKRRFFSSFYGWLQKLPLSKKKIIPFIERFAIDSTEFLEPVSSFKSFNDFFIRKLKPESRVIATSPAVIPADGRYRFYPKIGKKDGFSVKEKPFCLETVLQSTELAARFDGGSLVIARLCPTDCHRFYFPIDCTPSKAEFINGKLYSVNPIAVKNKPWIWGENMRMRTILNSELFGVVAFMEVGATNVASIIQTYKPGTKQQKGDEKGYFSFGGSALLIFFEPGACTFDDDLLGHSLEIRCQIGQSMGSLHA